MRWIFLLLIYPIGAPAQQKLDLDDIAIKGELHNDDRLRIIARERQSLQNFVKYRTNYHNEMTEELPRPKPKVKY